MKRVLVLYENMGSGHRRVARIVSEALSEEGNVSVTTVIGSEFTGNPGGTAIVTRLWNHLLERDWLRLNNALLNFVLRAVYLPVGDAVEGDKVYGALERYAPDAIVCTADMYSKMLGRYAELRGIPYSIFVTDVSVFLDLVHPHATHVCIFDPTVNAIRSFPFDSPYYSMHPVPEGSWSDRLKYVWSMYWGHVLTRRWGSIFRCIGMRHDPVNAARCVSIGPIVDAAHFEGPKRMQARSELGVDPDVPCVALLSGSLGGRCIGDWTQALQRAWPGALTVLAVCGRSETTLGRLHALAHAGSQLRVIPLGFVENMPTVYAAADAVIARPSAGVVTEALRNRRPLVLPSYAMANDLGCLQLVQQTGVGEVFQGLDDLASVVQRVVSSPETYAEAIDRLLAPYPRSFPELKSLIREVVLAS